MADTNDPQLATVLDESMIYIAAGYFIMGSDHGQRDERPEHTVYLDAFEIDRFETTNIQFQRFLVATGRTPPPYWSENNYPPGQSDYPVVGVSWEDADSYCKWAQKRLPAEAEWEKACRGTDGRIYPWGNTWDPEKANVDVSLYGIRSTGHTEFESSVWDSAWQYLQTTTTDDVHAGLRRIGSYPAGSSPYGVMDLVGNASEWVVDWYNWGDYSNMSSYNPRGLDPPWNHCLRGSPWHDPVGNAYWVQTMSRCSARNSSHADVDPRLGFRCARSLPESAPQH